MIEFFKNKKIFITGHTGFKGSWLVRVLTNAGAQITGYSLAPPTNPNLWSLCEGSCYVNSIIGDIRDKFKLEKSFKQANPEIVIHMAAQPIVRESYKNPAYTYETNVMGIVNILECVRSSATVKSLINVTTDKVYRNLNQNKIYCEDDVLDGSDPYSNSKSCSELVTRSYRDSFFADGKNAISTARSGNVIGGGDFAKDRIIPDCIRAAMDKKPIIVRNPNSIRPYQHVLEPIHAYLLIAQRQYENPSLAGCYNIGPNYEDCISTGRLVDIFCKSWGDKQTWQNIPDNGPHENVFLRLNCIKMKNTFHWEPKWSIETAVEMTVEWTKAWTNGENVSKIMDTQIKNYQNKRT